MDIQINPSKLRGEVNAPYSKSFLHRYIIAGFLSKEPCVILGASNSKDIIATLSALGSVGLNYSFGDNLIKLNVQELKQKATINCIESGSTLRFLLPVMCALGVKASFTGSERLLSRPTEKLVSCLNANGGGVDKFNVNGKLKSGKYVIDGTISSQYITGLLMALPLLSGDSEIIIEGESVSKDYINITLQVLKEFKIKIKKTFTGYYVYGNQKYKAPKKIKVEGDYSNASFLLSMGALSDSGIKVLNLNKKSKQGDKEIVAVLKKFGAIVKSVKGGYFVKKGNLKGLEIDCENIPDIVQIISVVASFSYGVTKLKNVKRLQIKESDRVQGIIDFLTLAGVKVEFDGNDLKICGGAPKNNTFDGCNDHRTVMSEAVMASSVISGASTIKGAEAVEKSYPNFFEDFIKLGGKINGNI